MPTRPKRVPLVLAFCTLLVISLFALTSPPTTGAQPTPREPLPPGTRVETVLDNMRLPVALAFDPQGRLFYTEKSGSVRLFTGGRLQPDPVISFSVSSTGERGLLGIAVDHNFNSNRFLYVYYTSNNQG